MPDPHRPTRAERDAETIRRLSLQLDHARHMLRAAQHVIEEHQWHDEMNAAVRAQGDVPPDWTRADVELFFRRGRT